MQLNPETLNLLSSFQKINNTILIRPGNTLIAMKPSKAVLARAELNQEIPAQMSIFDLSRFLSVLSLFEQPDLDIKEKKVVISSDAKKLDYTFADESMITVPPEKDIKFPTPDVSFEISADQVTSILKAQSILRLKELAVVGDGKKVFFQALDTKNPSADVFSIEIGKTSKKFKAIFVAENLASLLQDDYTVEITQKGLSSWKSTRVQYYIAIEAHSTFDK